MDAHVVDWRMRAREWRCDLWCLVVVVVKMKDWVWSGEEAASGIGAGCPFGVWLRQRVLYAGRNSLTEGVG